MSNKADLVEAIAAGALALGSRLPLSRPALQRGGGEDGRGRRGGPPGH